MNRGNCSLSVHGSAVMRPSSLNFFRFILPILNGFLFLLVLPRPSRMSWSTEPNLDEKNTRHYRANRVCHALFGKSTTEKVKEVSFNPNPFYPYPFRSYSYSGMDRNLRFSKTLLESSRMNQSSNLLGMEKKFALKSLNIT